MRQIGVEMSNQRLADVRMHLRVEHWTVRILAGENPFFKTTFFQQLLQYPGNILEVLAHFIFHSALRVPAIVSAEAIASVPGGSADGIDPHAR